MKEGFYLENDQKVSEIVHLGKILTYISAWKNEDKMRVCSIFRLVFAQCHGHEHSPVADESVKVHSFTSEKYPNTNINCVFKNKRTLTGRITGSENHPLNAFAVDLRNNYEQMLPSSMTEVR